MVETSFMYGSIVMILRTKERREKYKNKIFICVNERTVWKEGEIYKVLK